MKKLFGFKVKLDPTLAPDEFRIENEDDSMCCSKCVCGEKQNEGKVTTREPVVIDIGNNDPDVITEEIRKFLEEE